MRRGDVGDAVLSEMFGFDSEDEDDEIDLDLDDDEEFGSWDAPSTTTFKAAAAFALAMGIDERETPTPADPVGHWIAYRQDLDQGRTSAAAIANRFGVRWVLVAGSLWLFLPR